MPNWCSNVFDISGSKEEMKKFKDILNSPNELIEIICLSENKESLRTDYLNKQRAKEDYLDNILQFAESKTKPIDEFIMNEFKNESFSKIKLDELGNVIEVQEINMLQKFFPMPKDFLNSSLSKGELIKKYGYKDWYDWRVNNWGTKWEIDIKITYDDENTISMYFDTAWAPPVSWLEKISKDFPKLHFHLEYKESGCTFQGIREICVDSGLDIDETSDYYGDCGECETDYDSYGHCECVDDEGKKLVWGEEVEEEEEF